MIIGVTGNSGSGKTTVSNILAKIADAEVIDADKIVKEEQQKGKSYYYKIIENLGKELLLENLEINREKLASIIYSNKHKRDIMNTITNEYIVPIITEKAINSIKENVILDVPLLFESNLNKICDITIAIITENEIKLKRLSTREKTNEANITKRLSIQPENEYYFKRANYIIENNNDDLEKKVKEVWGKICLKHGKS